MTSISQIAEFYRDRSVFVTGGTGFLGKVLVEKLLRSCPDIKSIYLLMRPKKENSNVYDRLTQEFRKNIVFGNLVRERPEVMTKIIPVEGDVSLPILGMSPSDLQLLVEDVSVVFNSAATIRFNEPMRTAVQINVRGPQELLHICRQMKHLDALVHVSTAFNNLDKEQIEEVIYPTTISPQKLINTVNMLDDTFLQLITEKLVGTCPNTYIYTKAIAEQLLKEEKGDIPLAIVRPSMVTGAAKEPMPGWVDNINGPTGVIVGGINGFLRVTRSNPNLVGDIIPVDFTINLMIALAWYTANHKSNEIKVFTCSTGHQNPIKWGELHQYLDELRMKFPCSRMFWYPNMTQVTSKHAYQIATFFYHYIPAYIIDFLAFFIGKKTKLVYLYSKVDKFLEYTSLFSTQQWKFVSKNFITVIEEMSEQDRRVFNFDVRQIDWRTYIKDCCLGARRYILKEEDDTIPAALVSVRRLYWLQKATHTLVLLILAFVVYRMFY